MAWLKLSEISSMVGGALHGEDRFCEGVSIDTRSLLPQHLFIALKGERYDGHRFVEQSLSAGACAVMLERRVSFDIPQIVVADTLQALQMLARKWRARVQPLMVALTGSNGKTTSREMLCSILGLWCRFQATQGNLNNHIGVPISLLKLRTEDKVGVFEMGANHAGEIAFLTRMIQPDIGLVTNAAAAHLEGFGSLEGVAQAKGELFENLPDKATAVLNADDRYCDYWQSLLSTQKVIRFGIKQQAEVCGSYQAETAACRVCIDDETYLIKMPVRGVHNLYNALAACAVARALGVPHEMIIQGLESVTPVAGRLQPFSVTPALCLIDDTYNANPASLRSALDTLKEYPGNKWLVLGTMSELGEEAPQWHRSAATMARESGVTRLFTVGRFGAQTAESFGQGGEYFETMDALNQCLLSQLQAASTILVKGSRSAGMERVVKKILDAGRRINA